MDNHFLITLPPSPQSHDKLGRVVCKPTMIEAPYTSTTPTRLQWFDIAGVKRSKGELLAALELYEIGGNELPPLPRIDNKRYIVPDHIRPQLARTRLEVSTQTPATKSLLSFSNNLIRSS